VTWRLIYQNKPRGSTEHSDYAFDFEGNKVKFTNEMYNVRVKEMLDNKSTSYNPWSQLFAGYTRAWAEYPIFVMFLKVLITLAVVWMFEAKIRQSILVGVITLAWAAVLKIASPYISNEADYTDRSSKLCQVFALAMSLGAVLACGTYDAACTEVCFVNGDGFIIGITTNVVSGIVFVYQFYNMVMTMHFIIEWRNNRKGDFFFTEHNPASRLDTKLSAMSASLIYDLPRDKKQRLWGPFWDGICVCM